MGGLALGRVPVPLWDPALRVVNILPVLGIRRFTALLLRFWQIKRIQVREYAAILGRIIPNPGLRCTPHDAGIAAQRLQASRLRSSSGNEAISDLKRGCFHLETRPFPDPISSPQPYYLLHVCEQGAVRKKVPSANKKVPTATAILPYGKTKSPLGQNTTSRMVNTATSAALDSSAQSAKTETR